MHKILYISGILFLLTLTGCSFKKLPERKRTITFSWWGKDYRHEYTLKGLEIFQNQNPDINVEPVYGSWSGYEEQFDSLYKNHDTADVMQINFDWLYKYSPDGNGFYDMNELTRYLDLFSFTLSELSFGEMNGKLNAIPTAFNSIVPIYNKEVFAKYNLPIPETWDDIFKAAKTMKNDGYYIIGTGQKHLFLLIIAWFEQTHGKKVFLDNETFNLSQQETQDLILMFKKLLDEKVLFPQILSFNRNDIVTNKISGAVAWCSESSQYADMFKKQGGQAVLGNFISTPNEENSGWYMKPATMYAIKKEVANPYEAARLVNFLLNNPEMSLLQKCEKGIPASNQSLTALMENNQLAEMEYQALIKIRFNKGNINQMLPVMENKDILNSFYYNSMSFINQKTSLEDSSLLIYNDINKILSMLK